LVSFEEMIKANPTFISKSKSLSNIFQRFDIESRSLLYRLYAKHLVKYQLKQPLNLSDFNAPFTPSKTQKKTLKKMDVFFASPYE